MVIQRIQSLLLLIAAILMGCYCGCVWNSIPYVIPLALGAMSVIFNVIAIGCYRKPRFQIMTVWFAILMTFGMVAFIFSANAYPNLGYWTLVFPALSLILMLWSIARIRRDRNLLASVNRLR